MFFKKFFLRILPHSCLTNTVWKRNALYCSRCGELLGFYYLSEEGPGAHVCVQYERHAEEIKKTILGYARERIPVANNSDKEFRDFLDHFKEQTRSECLQSMDEDGDIVEEDCIGEEPAGS